MVFFASFEFFPFLVPALAVAFLSACGKLAITIAQNSLYTLTPEIFATEVTLT